MTTTNSFYVLGIDIGQAADYTALALLEHARADHPTYRLRALDRFPLGTPYTDLPPAISRRLTAAPLAGRTRLAVDATGVGAPVIDLFREQLTRRIPLYAITITGGATVTGSGDRPHVPKRDLIDTTAVILEQRRLQIARKLPHAETLVDELLAFRRTTSDAGHDTYGAAAGSHDDLVLALSLALWTGEHKRPPIPYRAGSGVPRGRIPGVDEMMGIRLADRYWPF